jgi:hypothetical protein
MQIFSLTLVNIRSHLSFFLPPLRQTGGSTKKMAVVSDLVCGAKESEVAFAIHVIGLI